MQLQILHPLFRAYYLSNDPDAPEPPSATSDASFGSTKTSLEDLGCGVLDFLTPAVRQKGASGLFVEGESSKGPGRATELSKGLVEAVLDWTQISRTSVSLLANAVIRWTGIC